MRSNPAFPFASLVSNNDYFYHQAPLSLVTLFFGFTLYTQYAVTIKGRTWFWLKEEEKSVLLFLMVKNILQSI